MKKYLNIFIFAISLALALGVLYVYKQPKKNSPAFSSAAADASLQPFEQIFPAKVLKVLSTDTVENKHFSQISQSLEVEVISGQAKGKQVKAEYQDTLSNVKLQEIKVNDKVVVGQINAGDEISYAVVDRYRLPYLAFIAAVFFCLAVIFARWRGLTSLLGLCTSFAVLIWFITPNILAGKNPSLVTFIGAGIIAIAAIFLAHGFSRRTSLAVVSTLLTLGLAQFLAYFFVTGAHLSGNGSEDAFFLQAGYFGAINLQGLFLGGIIIGTLGVLDDITTTQTAAVEEIYLTNKAVTFKELYKKAGSVGKEHITSLINTLVLTYAGASLPLFLLFFVGNSNQLWSILNSSTMAEEIVRTLVGSIALILAVPISTCLAAYFFTNPD